jgi:hypothetical protein
MLQFEMHPKINIGNIFKTGKLDEKATCRNFRITIQHGAIAGKTQALEVNGYNFP